MLCPVHLQRLHCNLFAAAVAAVADLLAVMTAQVVYYLISQLQKAVDLTCTMKTLRPLAVDDVASQSSAAAYTVEQMQYHYPYSSMM